MSITRTDTEYLHKVYGKAANGDREALQFIEGWHSYCHEIDDFVDLWKNNADDYLTILAHANILYSMPFFRKHAPMLKGIVISISNAWSDSVTYEKSTVDWQRQWADTLRFVGNDMITAVAYVTGGPKLQREVSLELRHISWANHHEHEKGI